MRYVNDDNKRLIKTVSELSGVGEYTTGKVIRALTEYMATRLSEGESVQLVPLGKLESKVTKARRSNLLKDSDGELREIQRRRRILFKPSSEFKERLIIE